MRKKLKLLLLFTFAFGVSLMPFKERKVVAENTRGFHLEQVFSDKFNKEELDSSWKLNGATLENNYNGLHCISPVPYGSGPIINAVTLDEKTQFNFTIYPQSGQTSTNISFNIGMESPSSPQKEPDVDCKVQFWNDQLVFTDWQHNLAVNQEKINEHVLRGFKGLFSDLLRTDISLIIERKNEFLTEMYAEYSRDGEIVYSSKNTPFQLSNPRYPHGYCGFFWDVVEMDLTNFEVYNNDKLVFKDSLEENTLTYPSTDPSLGNFHINNSLNESHCYFSRVSSVKMDDGNESIINNNALVKLENVSNPYQLQYGIKVNALENNSFFGFGFGLGKDDDRIDKKNAIGFIKNDDLTAEVVILKNGIIDRSNNYQVSLAKLINGKYTDFSISFDGSNNGYLTFGGLTFKFANIDYFGNSSVGLVSLNATSSSNVEMREFSMSRNVYNRYLSEDASNDFKGKIIPDETDPFYAEPYINNQKYSLGSGVSVEEDWTTGTQTLTFTNAGPYSRFGYSKEYSEWICEFDIELYTFQQGNMFGLSFGRKSLFDVLVQASTSNNTYFLRCDGNNTAEVTYGVNCRFDDGSTYKINEVNVFDKDNCKYHMMFVGKNRSVSVYYKASGAPDEELGILRSKVSNVNIDGYVSIVGNNGISFGITNYKIVNLSDDFAKESELSLRESFDDENAISDKITLNGATIENKALVLNNNSVKTSSSSLYEMIRFTTKEMENDLQISLSQDKKIIFDAKNDKVIIKEGETQTEYDAKEMNLKYPQGKRIELMIQGNNIIISYKGYYDPLDKLSQSFITHQLKTPLVKDNITFTATGKTVIDDLYLFYLDNSRACKTYNYEDDPNNATIWKIKPDFDPSKVYKPIENNEDENKQQKGCKGSLGFGSIPMLVCGLASLLVLKRRKEER